MLSNYPPGVTGLEPQIAGPIRSVVLEQTCDADPVITVPAELAQEILDAVVEANAGKKVNTDGLAILLRQAYNKAGACSWHGEVDVDIYSDGVYVWTCPACQTIHDEYCDYDYYEDLKCETA